MRYTAHLLRKRHWCYSPVIHCHELALIHDLPTDAFYWRDYNEHMLDRAIAMHVLALPGWRKSRGVEHERFHAMRREIKTLLINPTTYAEAHEAQL